MMKGILLGQLVLLLIFLIQTAMKCDATFCSDRYDRLQMDFRNHESRCSDLDDKESSCYEAEESSLKERMKNHFILCRVNSCADEYKKGERKDGIYTIDPDGQGEFKVRCDMTTLGGGWTVFQNRVDGSVDFYLGWEDYRKGFGDLLDGEFWLGLDKINRLSNSGENVLRVDLGDFENETRYAHYSTFAVANEKDKYRLTVGGYAGNAGDSLGYHNGMKFTTRDMDNNQWPGENCAKRYKGAWWYNVCHESNLNGLYLHGDDTLFAEGIIWSDWKGYYYSLKKADMKIRPRSF